MRRGFKVCGKIEALSLFRADRIGHHSAARTKGLIGTNR